jgi:hypothetical protein
VPSALSHGTRQDAALTLLRSNLREPAAPLAAPETHATSRIRVIQLNVATGPDVTVACVFLWMPARVPTIGSDNHARVTTRVVDHSARLSPRALARYALVTCVCLRAASARWIPIAAVCRAKVRCAPMAAPVWFNPRIVEAITIVVRSVATTANATISPPAAPLSVTRADPLPTAAPAIALILATARGVYGAVVGISARHAIKARSVAPGFARLADVRGRAHPEGACATITRSAAVIRASLAPMGPGPAAITLPSVRSAAKIRTAAKVADASTILNRATRYVFRISRWAIRVCNKATTRHPFECRVAVASVIIRRG